LTKTEAGFAASSLPGQATNFADGQIDASSSIESRLPSRRPIEAAEPDGKPSRRQNPRIGTFPEDRDGKVRIMNRIFVRQTRPRTEAGRFPNSALRLGGTTEAVPPVARLFASWWVDDSLFTFAATGCVRSGDRFASDDFTDTGSGLGDAGNGDQPVFPESNVLVVFVRDRVTARLGAWPGLADEMPSAPAHMTWSCSWIRRYSAFLWPL
jgi:hypothetical protein